MFTILLMQNKVNLRRQREWACQIHLQTRKSAKGIRLKDGPENGEQLILSVRSQRKYLSGQCGIRQQILRLLCCLRAASIGKGSCHLFSHAMATHMLENDADLRWVPVRNTRRSTLRSVYGRWVHTSTHPVEQTEADNSDSIAI